MYRNDRDDQDCHDENSSPFTGNKSRSSRIVKEEVKDDGVHRYYRDGSSSHTSVMNGTTYYDKDTGEEC